MVMGVEAGLRCAPSVLMLQVWCYKLAGWRRFASLILQISWMEKVGLPLLCNFFLATFRKGLRSVGVNHLVWCRRFFPRPQPSSDVTTILHAYHGSFQIEVLMFLLVQGEEHALWFLQLLLGIAALFPTGSTVLSFDLLLVFCWIPALFFVMIVVGSYASIWFILSEYSDLYPVDSTNIGVFWSLVSLHCACLLYQLSSGSARYYVS